MKTKRAKLNAKRKIKKAMNEAGKALVMKHVELLCGGWFNFEEGDWSSIDFADWRTKKIYRVTDFKDFDEDWHYTHSYFEIEELDANYGGDCNWFAR